MLFLICENKADNQAIVKRTRAEHHGQLPHAVLKISMVNQYTENIKWTFEYVQFHKRSSDNIQEA